MPHNLKVSNKTEINTKKATSKSKTDSYKSNRGNWMWTIKRKMTNKTDKTSGNKNTALYLLTWDSITPGWLCNQKDSLGQEKYPFSSPDSRSAAASRLLVDSKH